MNDLVFVQFFPLTQEVGKFMVADSKNVNEMKEKFLAEINACDPDHKSIFMIFSIECISNLCDIKKECTKYFHYMYK